MEIFSNSTASTLQTPQVTGGIYSTSLEKPSLVSGGVCSTHDLTVNVDPYGGGRKNTEMQKTAIRAGALNMQILCNQ